MKKIVQVIICVALLMLPYNGFSQSRYYDHAMDMDVSGVFIGGTYTKTSVENVWGGATTYRSSMSEFGLNETYYYDTTLFRFGDNGIFHSFNIKSSNFIVYTAFQGGIKVGDNIARVQTIGLGTPVLQNDGTYHLRRNNSTDPLIFTQSNGTITQIRFVTSI